MRLNPLQTSGRFLDLRMPNHNRSELGYELRVRLTNTHRPQTTRNINIGFLGIDFLIVDIIMDLRMPNHNRSELGYELRVRLTNTHRPQTTRNINIGFLGIDFLIVDIIMVISFHVYMTMIDDDAYYDCYCCHYYFCNYCNYFFLV